MNTLRKLGNAFANYFTLFRFLGFAVGLLAVGLTTGFHYWDSLLFYLLGVIATLLLVIDAIKRETPKKVWIVGRHKSTNKKGHNAWEVMGVFINEKDAVAACTTWNDFVGPIDLNKTMPQETVGWPDLYYPLAKYPIENYAKYLERNLIDEHPGKFIPRYNKNLNHECRTTEKDA